MYGDTPRNNGKIVGSIATALYFLGLVALMLLLKFSISAAPTVDQGIMINFGDAEAAAPGGDTEFNDVVSPRESAPSQPLDNSNDEILTQDHEDAPAIKPKTQAKPKPKPVKTPPKPADKPKPTETKPAEQPRQADRRALFPGRTVGSTSTSDGNVAGAAAGNQGDLGGRVDGSHDGTGIGNSGTAVVKGRYIVGSLPKPEYSAKDEGNVVIDIVVDQQGQVTRASFRGDKSTTNNPTLVDAAIRAARKARFNVDESDDLAKSGSITYKFRVK